MKLHTIFRDHHAGYSQSSDLEENTGFQFALRTGQPYLCNNVHASYKSGVYKNPRLKKISQETKAKITNKLRSQSGWVSLWSGDLEDDTGGAYRSTMIVPIDISRINANSRKNMHMNHGVVTAFLCIDHVSANYFDPKSDLSVLQTGANLFRSYFTTRHTVLVGTSLILFTKGLFRLIALNHFE